MPAWPAPLHPMLDGERVRLEPLSEGHRTPLRTAASHPEIWRWLGPCPAGSGAEWDAWFDAALSSSAAGEEAAFATIDARSGAALGSSRFLALRPADRGLEIGWTWLTPGAWGTGVNVEAKLLMLGHAFEALRCIRVELKTHAANERSRGAMTRMGASFEGVHRKHRIVPGLGVRDSAWFSVLDEEWPTVQRGLRERLGRHA